MKRSNFMSYLLLLATNYQFIVELKQRFEQQSEWRGRKRNAPNLYGKRFSSLFRLWFLLVWSWLKAFSAFTKTTIRSTVMETIAKDSLRWWTWNEMCVCRKLRRPRKSINLLTHWMLGKQNFYRSHQLRYSFFLLLLWLFAFSLEQLLSWNDLESVDFALFDSSFIFHLLSGYTHISCISI